MDKIAKPEMAVAAVGATAGVGSLVWLINTNPPTGKSFETAVESIKTCGETLKQNDKSINKLNRRLNSEQTKVAELEQTVSNLLKVLKESGINVDIAREQPTVSAREQRKHKKPDPPTPKHKPKKSKHARSETESESESESDSESSDSESDIDKAMKSLRPPSASVRHNRRGR